MSALSDNPDKTALQERLSNLQSQITEELRIVEATALVESAESVKTQVSVDNAQVSINKVSTQLVKNNLHARLDAVQLSLYAIDQGDLINIAKDLANLVDAKAKLIDDDKPLNNVNVAMNTIEEALTACKKIYDPYN